MLVLVLLFYLSNPRNKVNRWCTIGGIFFLLGIAKQAVAFEVMPLLDKTFETSEMAVRFVHVNSLCTWIIYTLAMPAMTVAALYFSYLNSTHPRLVSFLKPVFHIPGIVLSFFFVPLKFSEYQLSSQSFWISYTVYNFSFAIALTVLVVRGIVEEKAKNTKNYMKNERKQIAMVMLPPLYWWLVAIFVVHLIDILQLFDWSRLHELWQLNLFVTLWCISYFLYSAFNGGFMGLRLRITAMPYNWNENMRFVNENMASISHYLKGLYPKMEMSIVDLKEALTSVNASETALCSITSEIDDLSAYASALKEFSQGIHHYYDDIKMKSDEFHRIAAMIDSAISETLCGNSRITTRVDIAENVELKCNERYMIDVFVNILKNAAEAQSSMITVTGMRKLQKLKSRYLIRIKDDGIGTDLDLARIFEPLVSTKSRDNNWGFGLAHCKMLMEKLGASIYAESERYKGTTITIEVPYKLIAVNGVTDDVQSIGV
jgi:signal transduction histidine kinase